MTARARAIPVATNSAATWYGVCSIVVEEKDKNDPEALEPTSTGTTIA